jgi:uncharacterized protein YeaC (DUF1315 family)
MANKNNTNNGTENKAIDMNSLTEEQKEAMLRVFMEQQAQTTTESPKEETPKVDKETTEAPPTSEEVTEDVGEDEKTYTEEETASAYEIVKADKKAKRKKIRNKILKILGIAGAITAVGAAGYAIGHNSEVVPDEEDDDECDGSDAEFYDNESEEE